MRAQFVRDTENPLDSLDIGRVEERRIDKWRKPLLKAVRSVADQFSNTSGVIDQTGAQGPYIQVGFYCLGYFWYMGYDINGTPGGFYCGYSEIGTDKYGYEQLYGGQESVEETVDDCIYRLTSLLKEKE